MKDVVGWIALAISLCGHGLAARGSGWGWAIRAVAGPVWLTFALLQGSPPYIAVSAIYLGLDIYGAARRWAR